MCVLGCEPFVSYYKTLIETIQEVCVISDPQLHFALVIGM